MSQRNVYSLQCFHKITDFNNVRNPLSAIMLYLILKYHANPYSTEHCNNVAAILQCLLQCYSNINNNNAAIFGVVWEICCNIVILSNNSVYLKINFVFIFLSWRTANYYYTWSYTSTEDYCLYSRTGIPDCSYWKHCQIPLHRQIQR